ncbi:serine/threonine protein kinase [Lentzea alba]|uniref:serine/threonine-protein kinase n=1 Tax=Lentzea alba TaxID=2714351 RepID=UPI0039BFD626
MRRPSKIGRYPVHALLGTGAFAVVWLAEDERLHDRVAIKVLAENWAERLDVRQRFEQEARVLRRTRSHRVVEVFDIDELPDGRPYFVMTYADGGSLADRLQDGPLPVEQALRYGVELALGVEDLHTAGVLHRDVKPSNVLFRSGSGEPSLLVADLGLSRELSQGSRFTLPVGTAGYMAPEQDDPERVLDERADVYGAGATIYHALTGRTPSQPPAPPSSLRPGLPEGTDTVLLRALTANPDDRWPSAAAFAEALDGLLNHSRIPAPHKRIRASAVLVAAFIGVLALAGFTALRWAPATQTPVAQTTVTITSTTTPAPESTSASPSASAIPLADKKVPPTSETSERTQTSNPAVPPPPSQTPPAAPRGTLANCQHTQGSGKYQSANLVKQQPEGTDLGSVQLCRDSAQKYWAYVVLHAPLPEGTWANAYLELWTDGKYVGAYTCWRTEDGGSGFVKAGQTTCWSPKIDGSDARHTFLARAKVCRSPHPSETDCYASSQTARLR